MSKSPKISTYLSSVVISNLTSLIKAFDCALYSFFLPSSYSNEYFSVSFAVTTPLLISKQWSAQGLFFIYTTSLDDLMSLNIIYIQILSK